MSRFIPRESENQSTLPPEIIDDYVPEEYPVTVIYVVLVDGPISARWTLEQKLAATGRLAFNPTSILKLFTSGYPKPIR